MKIAILTSGILPVPAVKGGAVENLIDFYLEYNEKHGLHDVTVFSVTDNNFPIPTDRQKEKYNHYVQFNTDKLFYKIARKLYSRIHKCSYYNYFINYFLHKSLKLAKKGKFDMVILENRPGFAEEGKRAFDIPIMLHLHNDLLNSDTCRGKDIAAVLSGIICVSDFIRRRVETVCPPHVCMTVHNGIDTENFKRTNDRTAIRKILHLEEDDYVLIYSGRLIREKGIKELIEAVASIEDSSLKLVVMGASFFAGSSTDDPYVEELKQVASGLGNRIVFTGFVNYKEVPSYLSMADLAVLPSLWEEPLGLTCAEALAIGLPLITCNSGGIPEMVKAPNILVERGEGFINRLTEAIIRMKNNPIFPQPMPVQFTKEVYSKDFWGTIDKLASTI